MRIAFWGAVILLLAACNRTGNNPAVTDTPIVPATEAIPFTGYWVNKGYYDTLLLTGSPRIAQNGSTILVVPDSTGKPLLQGWNFHEGSSEYTLYKNDETYTVYTTSDDTLINTGSAIKPLSGGMLDFAGTTFVKIAGPGNDFGFPVVEEILFKGRYTDSAGHHIELTGNRAINGWPQFNHYVVISDYYDRGLQIDQLSLQQPGSNEPELLGFKFAGDTLKLYSINCIHEDEDGECAEVDFGELQYSLWRVK
jgi:hypothetical protein